ncbi:extensin family protein [Aestuariicoccus sp. KMU-90]|uniref:Extensin family protein n=2 Tax=Thetidibacter halocola TaxID=2827239 RepID=A0A8J7WDR8_9RHOB|nr:extensin family protein [Thetidibacter halocola]MBS0125755.1 extensin family protein [Thetidibacter halocola]
MTRDTGALDGVRSFLSTAFEGESAGGGLCGDPALVGEPVGAVEAEIAGCGIDEAVRLRAVGEVGLSQAALIDCATARALRRWIDDTAAPSLRRQGGGLAEIKVAAHYACRTRNHKPGAPISEHGRGKAIDISGFRLRDGSEVTVLNDWGSGKRGKALRQMHSDACGRFGTVLGPGSDGHHEDHFHFDTRMHRGGPYCR